MDVLATAYQLAGAPPTTGELAGTCARCSHHSDALTRNARRAIVSEQFTAFDRWQNPSGAGLCPACTWGHTHPPLRQQAHLVTSDAFGPLGRDQLLQLLTSPVPAGTAVIVPLRPGRKYLLPEATWGRVTTDTAQLPWTQADTDRLTALCRLREAGFGSRMLADPAPPWTTLRRHPRAAWPQILHDWGLVRPWRERQPWLDLALHATAAHPTRTAA